MKNSADQGGCYPQRPKTLRDLQNSSYRTKAEFNNCFIVHSKYISVLKSFAILLFVFLLIKTNTTSFPGFLGQQFSNQQRAVLLSF